MVLKLRIIQCIEITDSLEMLQKCRSLYCSWNTTCRRCSFYIFILDLILGFNGLGKDNCKTIWEKNKSWDLDATYIRGLPVVPLSWLVDSHPSRHSRYWLNVTPCLGSTHACISCITCDLEQIVFRNIVCTPANMSLCGAYVILQKTVKWILLSITRDNV